jgi:DNA (cytosine-5)-methyltransferase 1
MKKDDVRTAQIKDLEAHHGFDLSKYKLSNKRQILRNCVYPELGKYVLECALKKPKSEGE